LNILLELPNLLQIAIQKIKKLLLFVIKIATNVTTARRSAEVNTFSSFLHNQCFLPILGANNKRKLLF